MQQLNYFYNKSFMTPGGISNKYDKNNNEYGYYIIISDTVFYFTFNLSNIIIVIGSKINLFFINT